jgi:hypothetical protein
MAENQAYLIFETVATARFPDETGHSALFSIFLITPDRYVLYYLLAALVARFVDSFEEEPLTLGVTDEAHRRLVAISDKAAKFQSLSAEEQIKILNEIATSELS